MLNDTAGDGFPSGEGSPHRSRRLLGDGGELVVPERFSEPPGEGEGPGPDDTQPEPGTKRHMVGVNNELRVRGVAGEPPFLWGDEDDPTTRFDVLQVRTDEVVTIVPLKMFEDVEQDQRIKRRSHSKLALGELIGGERLQPLFDTVRDGALVVIDPHTVTVEIPQSSANAAPHIENKPQVKVADPPAVRVWDEPLPHRLVVLNESVGVVLGFRVDVIPLLPGTLGREAPRHGEPPSVSGWCLGPMT